MFSVDIAVNYLTAKKFGYRMATSILMASLETDENEQGHTQLAEVEAYKNDLRLMSLKDLEHKYLQAKQQEAKYEEQAEIERFYNLKSANADYVHWSKAAHWTLDEAIALSFGKEPELVSWEKIEQFKQKSLFVKAYAKRRDLALRATNWKRFGNTIPPITFINWAKEVDIDLPSELLSELEKIGHTAINWHKEYNKLKASFDALQIQTTHSNSNNTQKTENLLKAFLSIAIDAYGYDPKSQKSTTTNDILKALKSQGKTLDPKTIRAWLKEGIELLPGKAL